jgi:sterol desaturase/sphingolipid hydroxylase (fatty acid hydroxylase superfamily)
MDWIAEIQGVWLAGAYWWVGFCAAFLVLTRFCPCNPGRNWWTDRRAAITDMVYWLVMPLIGQAGRVVFLLVGVALIYGDGATPEFTARGWPIWIQCIAILLLQDVMMYWIHRLFHTRVAWKFHAVHHSPEVLDWTSAVRFHPVNALAEFAVADTVILLMGFSPLAMVILGPINLIYSVMVHANLNWTFGPLKYVFASPVFHRWHHTTEEEGLDRNFAPTFPFLDLLWGSFYMPAGKRPEVYGTNKQALPPGFVGQTVYPFRGSGAWAYRHPILTTVGVAASLALGYFGWTKITKPIDPQEEAMEITKRSEMPPELLRLSQRRDPRAASAVVANAAGSRLIYGSSDGSVTIRDVATERELAVETHPARVNALAISPNGLLGVSASGNGMTKVFSAETGTPVRTLLHDGKNIMGVAVSDDGWIATGTVDGTIWLWDAQGELAKKRTLPAASIQAIALSDAGRQVVVGQNSQVSVWDVVADTVTACQGLKNLAYCVNIRKDGKQIAAGEYDGRLHLWDLGSEQPRLVAKGHAGPIYSIAISSDGDSIVTGGADKIVRVWNAKTGAVIKELDGHPGLVFSVSFDATHQRVLAAGKDLALTGWNIVNDGVIRAVGKAP